MQIKMRKYIFKIAILSVAFGLFACQTSEDISKSLDHQVPDCKSVTLTYGTQNQVIDDNIVTQYFWGFVPQNNLEAISLPTITVPRDSTFNLSVMLSDNVALKSVTVAYGSWLLNNYINFANPSGDIPLTPKTYKLTMIIKIPTNAVVTPWLENFYFKDGLMMKITQSYHKIDLTVIDINMNKRIIPIFVKVQ